MSIADELLDSLIEDEPTTFIVDHENEPHIVVNPDRSITVPDQLKVIAVQYDHNVETVTFDCIRYWDGHDFSQMRVYINFRRSDGFKDQHLAENVRIDETDENIIHFEWTISRNVTLYKGNVTFLVCVKELDEEGNEEPHWNSQLNSDLTVLEGLECTETVVDYNSDIIETLLTRMDFVEEVGGATDEQLSNAVTQYLDRYPIFEPDETLNFEAGVLGVNTDLFNDYDLVMRIDLGSESNKLSNITADDVVIEYGRPVDVAKKLLDKKELVKVCLRVTDYYSDFKYEVAYTTSNVYTEWDTTNENIVPTYLNAVFDNLYETVYGRHSRDGIIDKKLEIVLGLTDSGEIGYKNISWLGEDDDRYDLIIDTNYNAYGNMVFDPSDYTVTKGYLPDIAMRVANGETIKACARINNIYWGYRRRHVFDITEIHVDGTGADTSKDLGPMEDHTTDVINNISLKFTRTEQTSDKLSTYDIYLRSSNNASGELVSDLNNNRISRVITQEVPRKEYDMVLTLDTASGLSIYDATPEDFVIKSGYPFHVARKLLQTDEPVNAALRVFTYYNTYRYERVYTTSNVSAEFDTDSSDGNVYPTVLKISFDNIYSDGGRTEGNKLSIEYSFGTGGNLANTYVQWDDQYDYDLIIDRKDPSSSVFSSDTVDDYVITRGRMHDVWRKVQHGEPVKVCLRCGYAYGTDRYRAVYDVNAVYTNGSGDDIYPSEPYHDNSASSVYSLYLDFKINGGGNGENLTLHFASTSAYDVATNNLTNLTIDAYPDYDLVVKFTTESGTSAWNLVDTTLDISCATVLKGKISDVVNMLKNKQPVKIGIVSEYYYWSNRNDHFTNADFIVYDNAYSRLEFEARIYSNLKVRFTYSVENNSFESVSLANV